MTPDPKPCERCAAIAAADAAVLYVFVNTFVKPRRRLGLASILSGEFVNIGERGAGSERTNPSEAHPTQESEAKRSGPSEGGALGVKVGGDSEKGDLWRDSNPLNCASNCCAPETKKGRLRMAVCRCRDCPRCDPDRDLPGGLSA